ncbi:Heme A synthase, cytochrome oxidase biogenesis protein Cox15-CtaA [Rubrivivax sp. A210]|uniref:COX15/CtaA family protein n=1 Tax=Rubrivivax sp. A210 TaxID=2772301 RepID=UPI00191A102C|nr:COX15/CtaA family protein [Rubrivivax sp. A210]CAD5372659.1 Heme A synthase, cytochrome oxidase biogenesis protein Cox15-CtaA [Rubrivivax sp. A210]
MNTAAASVAAVDYAPALRLLLGAALVALLPLAWVWLRQRDTPRRLAALTALTLFLTFDLVVFGAFTRLTDSGLGCPDWPGCYGEASPLGAREQIHAAQAALPDGPVTWHKAWIEMIHRYLAATVGALILVLAAVSWRERQRLPHTPWWPTLTLAWVIVQGLFGRWTVTLKLYPAIVTLHLLGGLALLVLLAFQHAAYGRQPLALPAVLRRGALMAMAVLAVQVALGGWVSTNYAVLACEGFPLCNGQAWPTMDFGHGFTLRRELGLAGHGGALPFEALVAIQMAHRLFAVIASAVLAWLAWALWRRGGAGRFGAGLGALLLLQWASGLSNVVLGWPLVAALGHSAGAAAMALLLALLIARAGVAPAPARPQPLPVAA